MLAALGGNLPSASDMAKMSASYAAMLSAAPPPPHSSITAEEARASQHWAGMDGAVAFHLIERHSDGWHDTGVMMQAWLDANRGVTPGDGK